MKEYCAGIVKNSVYFSLWMEKNEYKLYTVFVDWILENIEKFTPGCVFDYGPTSFFIVTNKPIDKVILPPDVACDFNVNYLYSETTNEQGRKIPSLRILETKEYLKNKEFVDKQNLFYGLCL